MSQKHSTSFAALAYSEVLVWVSLDRIHEQTTVKLVNRRCPRTGNEAQ